mmetsp:Transcript_3998/g.5989  ORF Transcript_3998/g.5989 Transcript_3998/m.5989 type:complete len:497 (+) Transcript_3998:3-1493(+)
MQNAKSITPLLRQKFHACFESSAQNKLVQRAVISHGIDSVAVDKDLLRTIDPLTFSVDNFSYPVTNQKASGRCWLFAALNLYRTYAIEKMGLKSGKFEFSQNYLFFFDKFERSNYFFEAIIETANLKLDDRLVSHLLDAPLDDGGQWSHFANIVSKYGLIPKQAMGETKSSSATRRMNGILLLQLRQGASQLRTLINDKLGGNAQDPAVQALKQELLETIYRTLCIHLGTPPSTFEWQWRTSSKEFHRLNPENPESASGSSTSDASSSSSSDASSSSTIPPIYAVTPQQFAEAYAPKDEYVCLVHDPRETSPYNATATVKYLGNVVGGKPVLYLNLPIEKIKELTAKALKRGEAVWFGCDVGKQIDRASGVWDANILRYDQVYQCDRFLADKKTRLLYHMSAMTHAMLFVGVDLDNDVPIKWKVENSWGEDRGNKGYYCMNDSWFDDYVFEVAVKKTDLSDELIKVLEETKPIELPPWDPLGALAKETPQKGYEML